VTQAAGSCSAFSTNGRVAVAGPELEVKADISYPDPFQINGERPPRRCQQFRQTAADTPHSLVSREAAGKSVGMLATLPITPQ
jgi:hypothetical protein